MSQPKSDKTILVIGGGIAGMTAAVEAAEVGYKVVLVEKEPFLGGRVVRMNQYFPKLCPPTCGMEINARRVRQNPLISVYTMAEVTQVGGSPGDYTVTVKVNPRYVTGKVDLDASHAEAIASERVDTFNADMGKTKALYRPHPMSYPSTFVLDRAALSDEDKGKLESAAPEGAIDFDMQPETVELKAGAIIVATGWVPYDARKIENLGFGACKNVITNIMMERLASESGPTGGKIQRPGDGKEPASVAFVQCAGSRDENHLQYCSGVCCMASMKQARYVRELYPAADIYLFYIDVRAMGRNEDFFAKVAKDGKLILRKGKVADIVTEASGRLTVVAEDVASGLKTRETVDLVVLATGMQPSVAGEALPAGLKTDDYGFFAPDGGQKGIYSAGCAKSPVDVATAVQDATGTALKAIQTIVGEAL